MDSPPEATGLDEAGDAVGFAAAGGDEGADAGVDLIEEQAGPDSVVGVGGSLDRGKDEDVLAGELATGGVAVGGGGGEGPLVDEGGDLAVGASGDAATAEVFSGGGGADDPAATLEAVLGDRQLPHEGVIGGGGVLEDEAGEGVAGETGDGGGGGGVPAVGDEGVAGAGGVAAEVLADAALAEEAERGDGGVTVGGEVGG